MLEVNKGELVKSWLIENGFLYYKSKYQFIPDEGIKVGDYWIWTSLPSPHIEITYQNSHRDLFDLTDPNSFNKLKELLLGNALVRDKLLRKWELD